MIARAELSDQILEWSHTLSFTDPSYAWHLLLNPRCLHSKTNMFSVTVHFAITNQWLSGLQVFFGAVYVLPQGLLVETLLHGTRGIVGMYTGIVSHNA